MQIWYEIVLQNYTFIVTKLQEHGLKTFPILKYYKVAPKRCQIDI